MNNHEMLQCQGPLQPLDNTLNQAYVNAIKKHIELLEAKKREIENQMLHTDTPNIDRGIIAGLNYAIEQLYYDINHITSK